MLNSNRRTNMPGATANVSPGLEAIDQWLRGLSSTEIRELGEALANHDTGRLAGFHIKFKAWLTRSGQSQ
jgi:hypothetical protein